MKPGGVELEGASELPVEIRDGGIELMTLNRPARKKALVDGSKLQDSTI